MIRLAWQINKERVYQLFLLSVLTGHYPRTFKGAVVVMIQKPNKPDRTKPQAYRPIALLSVLGKGLERLVARRMAWIAVTRGVLARQQFGALPLRSAVDLTTCLTHDVEDALSRGKVASC